MDPSKLLTDLRADAQEGLRIAYTTEPVPYGKVMETLTSIAEAVDNLDNWMMRGGFPPEQWQRAAEADKAALRAAINRPAQPAFERERRQMDHERNGGEPVSEK